MHYGTMMGSMVKIFLIPQIAIILIVFIGLIRWGIIIHGFIDGYSRLITALRANNNNTGQAVLELFLQACAVYGVPFRLRGDHGVECYGFVTIFCHVLCFPCYLLSSVYICTLWYDFRRGHLFFFVCYVYGLL